MSRTVLLVLLFVASDALSQQPLDLANTELRLVLVEIENTTALDVVGVQYSDSLPAS